ncbi:MAG TPA: glycosyltransferase family 1 protein [Candidatus Baltobacteraceae bacterium]
MLDALPAAGIDAVPLRMPSYDPWRFDRRVIWDQVFLPLRAMQSGAQLLHCTSGSVPLFAPLPIVVTVHDVAWLRGIQAHAPRYARWYFGPFSAERWRSARYILVDSYFTRDELLTFVPLDPARIVVVHPGVDATFGKIVRRPSSTPSVLCVGTLERRKNAAIVIDALARIPDVQLICAGPPTPYQAECEALAQRLGIANRVRFAGYLEPAALLELYAMATLAVAPSRYEGFGYAAAQALCAGIPLITARSSSLIEVVQNESPLLSPDEPASWTDAMRSILDAQDAANLRAAEVRSGAIARFAWQRAAAETAAVYRNAVR